MKAPRKPRRSSEEVASENRARRDVEIAQLRAQFPGVVVFDVFDHKGPEAKASALRELIAAHNAGKD